MHNVIPREQKNPNPQGKGCVTVLQDWDSLRPQLPGRKRAVEVLRDYCLSSLVLAAKFRFKPVPGKSYYLYCDEGEWTLSLIAPDEWGQRQPGDFAAHCCLRPDMTWQLEFGQLADDGRVRQCLEQFVEAFSATVSRGGALEDGLPFYVSNLPYYQRMLATGLAVSVKHSLGGIGSIDGAALARPLPALLAQRQ